MDTATALGSHVRRWWVRLASPSVIMSESRVVRGGAECGGGSVKGDCPGPSGGAKGAEAAWHALVDIGDEGGGRPTVKGGCEFGDLLSRDEWAIGRGWI